MSTDGLTGRLEQLLDKQDIYDVLARYCRGVDRNDKELIRSAFHPDATHDHDSSVQPATQIFGGDAAGPPELTMVAHSFGNVLIELRGDAAWCESYFVTYHRVLHEDAEWDWNVGGRYVDRFERRGGRWAISHRTAIFDWQRTDKVDQRPDSYIVATADGGRWGRGDRDDFSYELLAGLDS